MPALVRTRVRVCHMTGMGVSAWDRELITVRDNQRKWHSVRMAALPNAFFEVGEIRPARESDFQHFLELADGGGWTKKMDKNGILAWTRHMENSAIKMFKVS